MMPIPTETLKTPLNKSTEDFLINKLKLNVKTKVTGN